MQENLNFITSFQSFQWFIYFSYLYFLMSFKKIEIVLGQSAQEHIHPQTTEEKHYIQFWL